jgi:hypothetical protein
MFNKFALFVSKIDRQHVQLLIAVAALAMLVLGVGAPSSAGTQPPH